MAIEVQQLLSSDVQAGPPAHAASRDAAGLLLSALDDVATRTWLTTTAPHQLQSILSCKSSP